MCILYQSAQFPSQPHFPLPPACTLQCQRFALLCRIRFQLSARNDSDARINENFIDFPLKKTNASAERTHKRLERRRPAQQRANRGERKRRREENDSTFIFAPNERQPGHKTASQYWFSCICFRCDAHRRSRKDKNCIWFRWALKQQPFRATTQAAHKAEMKIKCERSGKKRASGGGGRIGARSGEPLCMPIISTNILR